MPFTDPTRIDQVTDIAGLQWLPNRGINRSVALRADQVGNVLPVAETEGRPTRGPCPPGTEGEMNSGFRDFALDPRTADGKPAEAEITELTRYYRVARRTVLRWFNMADALGRHDPRNFVPVFTVGKSIDTLRARTQEASLSQAARDNAERALRRLYLAAPLVVYGGLQQTQQYTKSDRQGNPYVIRSHEQTLVGCARSVRQVVNGGIRIDDINLERAWVQMDIYPMPWGWDVVCLFFYPQEDETP